MIMQRHRNQELLKSEEIRKTKLWPQLLPIENKRELMQHKGTLPQKLEKSSSALVQLTRNILCFQYLHQMQCKRAEAGLCSSQEHFQTFGRTGCAMEGFSVLALSKATPLIYHSCSIYLYLVSASLPYYVQFIFKSVLFPLVGIQELFCAFSISAPTEKHLKKDQRCQRFFQC